MKENTEHRILEAAKHIFTIKGMNGARMQEIADRAKINKALLHYYFRTKDKLFEAVFVSVFNTFVPETKFLYDNKIPFFQKIEIFCDKYITLLQKNPFIPNFILTEFYRKPERLKILFKRSGYQPSDIIEYINKEIKKNNIINCTATNLLINIISMCVGPIAGKPIFVKVLFNDNEQEYATAIENRKKEVALFIINSLKSDKA